MKTRYEKVKEFTEKSGIPIPEVPRKMNRTEVSFITRMILEELQELLLTVANPEENTKDMLIELVNLSRLPTNKVLESDIDIIAEQVDAFVDIDYYSNNAASKVGMNTDAVFDLVHEANMSKLFPDGTFHKDESGKIIKPPNWKEPDVKLLVESWFQK